MSVNELTKASGWIAGLAIVALIAAGWRKPARAAADPARAARRPWSRRAPVAVRTLPAPLYRRTPVWKRVWALIGSGTIGVVMGALIAISIASGVAWVVITLTSMLRR